mgnify:CR=1 FL=1
MATTSMKLVTLVAESVLADRLAIERFLFSIGEPSGGIDLTFAAAGSFAGNLLARNRSRRSRRRYVLQVRTVDFGTKSSGAPGGISSSTLVLSSNLRTAFCACCITHHRT